MVRRGDVWWAEVPGAGHRPVLVLTRDDAIPLLRHLVCVPLTTSVRSVPAELALGEDDGLPRACVANFDDVRPVTKSALKSRITQLGPEQLREACATLNIALGC